MAAHEDDGEHLGQQAQALHQLLRPFPLDPQHADRERSSGGAADDEGHECHRFRPEREDGGAVGRGLVGQFVGTGEADDVTLAEATGDPRELRGLEHPWHGSHPFPRPGVRDTDQALGGELAETGAVDPEVFDDTAKAALDLLIGLVGPGLEETGAEVGQERLEPQAFVEPVLVSLPLPALDEQAHDEQRLEPGHHAGRCDLPFIEVPDRRFAEEHDASGW